jgi:hypothetical protein
MTLVPKCGAMDGDSFARLTRRVALTSIAERLPCLHAYRHDEAASAHQNNAIDVQASMCIDGKASGIHLGAR